MRYVGFGLLALIAIVVVWALTGVNAIPKYEENAHATWAQVLNQYQRRADLVPNLVETVKGAAKFEQDTLTAVTEARARLEESALRARFARDSLVPAARALREQALAAYRAGETSLLAVLDALRSEREVVLAQIQDFIAFQAALSAWRALFGRIE